MSDVAAKVESFFGTYPLRKYKKGQVLILNGEKARSVHYLIKGTVKQYDVTYRGDEIVLNLFKPGAFFPMSLVLNEAESPYIFEAESDIELRAGPPEETVEFLRTNPDVLLDLLSRVYRGTDALLGRITQLVDGSAKTRLCYELVLTAKRFGSDAEDGSHTLAISEKDLAARAGLSRETVSRELQKLKELGLVRLERNSIYLPNLTAIEAIAA